VSLVVEESFLVVLSGDVVLVSFYVVGSVVVLVSVVFVDVLLVVVELSYALDPFMTSIVLLFVSLLVLVSVLFV
jgi:hypothetical protein